MGETTADSAETRALLERIRSGDRAALDRLLKRHRDYVRRVVTLRMDRELQARLDPSDLVQETQVTAVRRIDDYLARRPMPFRLWLRETAQEHLVMARRQHLGAARRAVGREISLPQRSSVALGRKLVSWGSSPSRAFWSREIARQVRRALEELSDADREIILLRNFERLTNQETAQLLGIEPPTASKRYGRALLRLRTILVHRGLTGESHG